MRKLLVLFFFLFSLTHLPAQQLTQEQAISYANKLYEKEILSKKGKEALIKAIQNQSLEREATPNWKDGSFSIYKENSMITLLAFCARAFWNDRDYRMAFEKRVEVTDRLMKNIDYEKLSEADKIKLQKKYQRLCEQIAPQMQIESRIPDEDSVIHSEWISFPHLQKRKNEEFGWTHPKRSVLGKTRTRTARELFEIGIIDSRVYTEVRQALSDSSIADESGLFAYATERTNYYATYQSQKTAQVELMDSLKAKGVLSPEGYQKLLASYQEYESKSKFDMLSFCEKALVFDLKKYQKGFPEEYYSLIFEEIKKILPEFDYKNLTLKTTIRDEDSEQDSLTPDLASYWTDITVSFQIKDKFYQKTFSNGFTRKDPKVEAAENRWADIASEFVAPINRFLTDQNRAYRLYYCHKKGKYAIYERDEEFFGLIVLTKEQAQAWGHNFDDYFLSDESHDNRFNSENIQKLIAEYEQIGLFSHLTPKEITEGKNCVREKDIRTFSHILLCFPKTLNFFDWETGNLTNPYEELTRTFAVISRGAFTPTEITDQFEKDRESKTTPYGFRFKGKWYGEQLAMNSDWLDPAFFDLIKKALQENGVDGEYYYCIDDGQASGYIFLTRKQYDYLKARQPELFPE